MTSPTLDRSAASRSSTSAHSSGETPDEGPGAVVSSLGWSLIAPG
ncbi:MAG: hypothetical protein ABIV05_06795 [Actinomycetota bacterium]